MVCSGDSSQVCGGDWKNSVFRTNIMTLGADQLGNIAFINLGKK